MAINVRGQIFLAVLLLATLLAGCDLQYEDPDPNVEVTVIFPCEGFDEIGQPLEVRTSVPTNTSTIYICAYQRKGGPGLFTIEWHSERAFHEFTYIKTDDGWFYPVLDVNDIELPVGLYRVRVKAGRSVQAETYFEVVSEE